MHGHGDREIGRKEKSQAIRSEATFSEERMALNRRKWGLAAMRATS